MPSSEWRVFKARRETSDILRVSGILASLTLVDGCQVTGEIATPFPQGLRNGTFTMWLFGTGQLVVFGRTDVASARVYASKNGTPNAMRERMAANRRFLATRRAHA